MEIIRDKRISSSIVMAIGVGGGGGNAINCLYSVERNISFLLCNTDAQALKNSPLPDYCKVEMGRLGAGNKSEVGRNMALKSVDKIRTILTNNEIRMIFIVAGMGGGTGTGASPVIAKVARELGILTTGVVTIPFESEGRPRIEQAIQGVDELSKNVDSLIIINNANIVDIYGNLGFSQALSKSNDIISKAVKSISDIITHHFLVNVDFADVSKVMRNSGVALMGTGLARGEGRALAAAEMAITSPLLHNQDITGSKNVLVCITTSHDYELRMGDTKVVTDFIQEKTKTFNTTDVIWGAGYDDTLGEDMQVTVIATGFNVENIPAMKEFYRNTLQPFSEDGSYIDDSGEPGRRISFDLNEEIVEKQQEKPKSDPDGFSLKAQKPPVYSRKPISPNRSPIAPTIIRSKYLQQNDAKRQKAEDNQSQIPVQDFDLQQDRLTDPQQSENPNDTTQQVFYDEINSVPAFKRRNYSLGGKKQQISKPAVPVSSVQKRHKLVLDVEEETPQDRQAETPSLF